MIFISNYFNHHQKYISEELSRVFLSYYFVSNETMSESRKKLGYGVDEPDYVIKQKEHPQKVAELIRSDDVVVIGSAPEDLLDERKKSEKLIFRYSERPLKNGLELLKYPVRFIRWHKRNPMSKPIYMLCASAYTAADYRKFGLFNNCTYKWGYFPEVKQYNTDVLMANKKKTRILWCGRFLDCKHPDDVIVVAERLKAAGYLFEINMIGIGAMEQQLRQMVTERVLDDHIHFLGSMKPEQVREHMETAGIYLFTSDREEGWGAVLNESMNSGCAVVASHIIGSVPFLIKNGENGLVYRSGDVEMLYEKVKYLLDYPEEQTRLGINAYRTIANEWNAKIAAERFKNLAEHILSGENYPDLYQSGPCSRAEIIKDNWF